MNKPLKLHDIRRRARHGEAGIYFLETVLMCLDDKCLIWPFACSGTGYASFHWCGCYRLVCPLVCEAVHGPRPSIKHDAAHSCGNGHLGCVNPQHLRWATRKENMKDTIEHGTTNRGERQGHSKLTEEQVKHIRRLRNVMKGRDVAKKFGIDPSTVCQIQKRDRWEWL